MGRREACAGWKRSIQGEAYTFSGNCSTRVLSHTRAIVRTPAVMVPSFASKMPGRTYYVYARVFVRVSWCETLVHNDVIKKELYVEPTRRSERSA